MNIQHKLSMYKVSHMAHEMYELKINSFRQEIDVTCDRVALKEAYKKTMYAIYLDVQGMVRNCFYYETDEDNIDKLQAATEWALLEYQRVIATLEAEYKFRILIK